MPSGSPAGPDPRVGSALRPVAAQRDALPRRLSQRHPARVHCNRVRVQQGLLQPQVRRRPSPPASPADAAPPAAQQSFGQYPRRERHCGRRGQASGLPGRTQPRRAGVWQQWRPALPQGRHQCGHDHHCWLVRVGALRGAGQVPASPRPGCRAVDLPLRGARAGLVRQVHVLLRGRGRRRLPPRRLHAPLPVQGGRVRGEVACPPSSIPHPHSSSHRCPLHGPGYTLPCANDTLCTPDYVGSATAKCGAAHSSRGADPQFLGSASFSGYQTVLNHEIDIEIPAGCDKTANVCSGGTCAGMYKSVASHPRCHPGGPRDAYTPVTARPTSTTICTPTTGGRAPPTPTCACGRRTRPAAPRSTSQTGGTTRTPSTGTRAMARGSRGGWTFS